MRVLVADDHSLFRDGIISLLEAADFEVVGQAGSGNEAVEQAVLLRPDLVLMDINMPEMGGLEALRLLKDELPETKVVMLTVSDSDVHLFDAIKSGAQGFLQKSLNAEDFLEMLEGLKQGEAAITRRSAARLLEGYANLSQSNGESPDQLTAREVEMLSLVAEGLSNRAIALQLKVSENTVKYHLRNILQKTGAKNRTEAATYALRAGLLASDRSD